MSYDAEQLAYITCRTKNNVVFGPPGSGKSTALRGRIEHLLSEGHVRSSQLVMTFYLTTKENLTARLQDVFGSETARQVRTVHSICFHLLSEATKDATTSIVRALRVPGATFATYFTGVSHVYVDEGQLLDSTAIDLVRKIRTCCPWISVDLLGDPAQNCQTEVGGEDEEFLMQYDGPRYELLNNYRSCARIVDFCNRAHPFTQMKSMRSTTERQGSVRLFCGTRDEQLAHLFDFLASVSPHESKAILCSCRHPHPQMRTHLCCQDVANALDGARVPFGIWYDENKSRSELSSVKRGEHALVISTIQGTLGREFDHVIQFSYHHRLNKRTPTHAQHYHNTKLNNIARSRARLSFTMCCGDDMDMFITPESAMRCVEVASSGRAPRTITNPFKKGVFAADDATAPNEQNVVRLGSLSTLEPRTLMALQDLFAMRTVERRRLWTLETCALPDYDVLCTLYGKFAESVVYSAATGCFPDQQALRSFSAKTIFVKDGDSEEVQYVVKELNLIERRMSITRRHVDALKTKALRLYKSSLTQRKMKRARLFRAAADVVDAILSHSHAADETLSIHFENKNVWFDMDALKALAHSETTPENIFAVCLFWWQYENQAAWRMSCDYSEHVACLSRHVAEWRGLASGLRLENQVPVVLTNNKFCNRKVVGAADSISEDDSTLYEWKFSQSGINNTHRLQAVLYAYALQQATGVAYGTTVVNLWSGEIETIEHAFVTSDDLFRALFESPDEEPEPPDGDGDGAAGPAPSAAQLSIVPF